MALLRRTQYLFFTLESLRPQKAPSQEAAPSHEQEAAASELVLTSILSGQHLLVAQNDIEILERIPCTSWSHPEDLERLGLSPQKQADWTSLGVLLADREDENLFLDLDNRLTASHWPPCAALFHLLNHYQESRNAPFGQLRDTAVQEQEAEQRAEQFLATHGMPPSTFFRHPASQEILRLPQPGVASALAGILLERRTCRHFDSAKRIELEDLAQLLRLTLGPVASRSLAAGKVQILLKTSPSGGALHPIEGFPLLLRCGGAESGIYHYRVGSHDLALLKHVTEAEGRQLAVFFAQGQDFVGTCAALLILVARFDRNYWKYRERENSYAVILQDAGHLSQTFQLVATDLGLGSFYTAAINSDAITEFLGLRYPAEAAIGLLGVGVKSLDDPQVGVPFALEESL